MYTYHHLLWEVVRFNSPINYNVLQAESGALTVVDGTLNFDHLREIWLVW